MAVIRIGNDALSVTLQGGGNDYFVTRYIMQSPQPSSTSGASAGNDFSLNPFEWQNVTESLELLISGTTEAALRTNIQTLQRVLERARIRQKTGMGEPITIEFDGWDSEILAARLVLDNGPHDMAFFKTHAVLHITRRYFWEATRVQIETLTSSEDSTPAAAVTFYNNDDVTAAATNWVNVPAAVSEAHNTGVAGVLPTPAEIHITEQELGTVDWREIYVTNTVFSDPANFDPFLLGSEAAAGATFAWSTTVEEVAWRWLPAVLTDARLTDLGGRYYHVLVAFVTGATTGVYLRPVVEIWDGSAATALYTGGLVYYNGEGLIDLGMVPLPPGGYDLLGTDISLAIQVWRPAGGSSSMVLDFVQLTPAGDGLFQRMSIINSVASNNGEMVIDGIRNIGYRDDGGRRRAVGRLRGLPVMLFPGYANRLRILFRDATGFTPGEELTATVFYRPRRLDL